MLDRSSVGRRLLDDCANRGPLRFADHLVPRRERVWLSRAFQRRAKTLFSTFVCVGSVLCSGLCRAQVLEVDEDGVVTVHDRPEVFTAEGSTPIPAAIRIHRRMGRVVAPNGDMIGGAAQDANLSPALVEAVAWRESRMRPGVISRSGAIGEMQLMPATARAMGVDPRDTRQNYGGGAAYLRLLLNRYNGDLVRVLAAYNAGPKAVDRYGGVPPFRETQAYVAAIMDRLSQQAVGANATGSGG